MIHSLVGRTLGPYVLQEPLGYGGMATVYRGYQPSLGRPVAVKVLAPIGPSDPSFPARFRREARLAANLMHPNIVPVYDFGEWDGHLCIVMALITGGTLKERIQGPLPVSTAILLVGQIADALAYAHSRGILHRDIKPANIMLAAFDWAMLGDFGVARALGETTPLAGPAATIGTPAYMAPEQCLGGEVDRRTDIYSLGVVLYEMLAGVPPFTAQTPSAMMRAHLESPVPPLSVHRSHVPSGLEDVIQRALAKEPVDRFRHASEFKAELEAATSAAIRPRSPGEPTHTPRPVSYMVPNGRPSVEPDGLVFPNPARAPEPPTAREPSAPTTAQVPVPALRLPRPPIDRPNRRRPSVIVPIAIVGLALLLVTALATAAGVLVANGGDEVAEATPTAAPIAGVAGRPTDSAPTAATPAPPTLAPVVVETPEAAVASSTQTATATPSPSDGLQEARALLAEDDAGRAIEILEALKRRDGTSPELEEALYQAYLQHGQATLGRNDLDLSYAMFAEAARLRPNDPAAHDGQKQVIIAKAWARMEATWTTDPDASIAALEEIVRLDPNSREARPKLYAQLVGKAKRLIQANLRVDALPVLQRAVEANPNGDEARQLLLSYTPTPAPTPRPRPTPTALQDGGAVAAPVPQPSGPSARPVLSAHAIAQRMIAAGDSITLTYEVTNPGSTPATAILGASIRPISGGPWIDDPANDKRLTFPPGTSSYTRVFRVPIGTPAGRYDVAWGLFGDGRQGWGPAVESGVLTINQ